MLWRRRRWQRQRLRPRLRAGVWKIDRPHPLIPFYILPPGLNYSFRALIIFPRQINPPGLSPPSVPPPYLLRTYSVPSGRYQHGGHFPTARHLPATPSQRPLAPAPARCVLVPGASHPSPSLHHRLPSTTTRQTYINTPTDRDTRATSHAHTHTLGFGSRRLSPSIPQLHNCTETRRPRLFYPVVFPSLTALQSPLSFQSLSSSSQQISRLEPFRVSNFSIFHIRNRPLLCLLDRPSIITARRSTNRQR